MIRADEKGTRVLLKKGRLFSRQTLVFGLRVIFSKSPALDWAKGQMVILVFSILLLSWGLAGVFDLVFQGYGQGSGNSGQVAKILGIESREYSRPGAGTGGNERLRNDLFMVTAVKKKVVRKEPKTNPVELLKRIELQGVMGGSSPKAIVQYRHNKKTVTVSAGDDLGEFKVMEIRERSVILKWRDELFELSL